MHAQLFARRFRAIVSGPALIRFENETDFKSRTKLFDIKKNGINSGSENSETNTAGQRRTRAKRKRERDSIAFSLCLACAGELPAQDRFVLYGQRSTHIAT